MIEFSGIVLFIVSFYATINFYLFFTESRRIFHLFLGATAVFLAIIGISDHLAHFFPILNPDFIDEWSKVFAVSFILSAAAALIRDFKPAFDRFPRIFTFFPLLLILVYPFIMEMSVLKSWVMGLYQFSSILIGLLVYSYETSKNNQYGYMLVGIIFFLLTFVLLWLPETVFALPEYVWVLLTACGVLIITVGYNQVSKYEKNNHRGKEEGQEWFT